MKQLYAAILLVSATLTASADVFFIGNSLTADVSVPNIDDAERHIFCGRNLQYIYDNPLGHCTGDASIPWDVAMVDNQYDYVSVQPYNGTTLAQDAFVITEWMDMQPDAIFVIHTAWGPHATHAADYLSTDTSTMINSAAYFDALQALLETMRPGREIRQSLSAEVVFDIAQDIAAGTAPYTDLSELYRDDVHMTRDDGRYFQNNLMRLALDQPMVIVGGDAEREYLNSILADQVPEPGTMALLLAGAAMVLRRRA